MLKSRSRFTLQKQFCRKEEILLFLRSNLITHRRDLFFQIKMGKSIPLFFLSKTLVLLLLFKHGGTITKEEEEERINKEKC